MLLYKRLITDLTRYSFKVNLYDACVANRILVDGKQLAVLWHVDDLKASHKDSKVIDEFITRIEKTYGKIGKMKVGSKERLLGHEIELSRRLNYRHTYSDIHQVNGHQVPARDLLLGPKVPSPWNKNLFKVDRKSPKLSRDKAEK